MSIQKPLDTDELRKQFPILKREVDGKKLVYLDNAATSQKPKRVVNSIEDFYNNYNANVHRGMHKLSQEASIAYEEAHDKVADFIGAKDREEIAFTSNTTEAINTVAFGWGIENITKEDNIVLTEMEHHSSLVPWQQIVRKTGAELRFIEVNNGLVNNKDIDKKIDEDTKIASIIHVSNVFGTKSPVKNIVKRAHEVDAKVLVDGAQSVPHMSVDVEEIDCDFLAFSGHKMCGPTGTGVLYGKKELMEEMNPYRFGGEMIKKVSYDDASWADLPWKFEGGTPNIAGAICLGEAIDFLDEIGLEKIQKHEKELGKYTAKLLEKEENVTVYGPSPDKRESGVVSFNVSDAHPHDTSDILDSEGIATRSGHHCAQPLMNKLEIPATSRASFYLYNTKEEADKLLEGIRKVKDIFD